MQTPQEIVIISVEHVAAKEHATLSRTELVDARKSQNCGAWFPGAGNAAINRGFLAAPRTMSRIKQWRPKALDLHPTASSRVGKAVVLLEPVLVVGTDLALAKGIIMLMRLCLRKHPCASPFLIT